MFPPSLPSFLYFVPYYIKHLLCAQSCVRHWGTVLNKIEKVPDIIAPYILGRT